MNKGSHAARLSNCCLAECDSQRMGLTGAGIHADNLPPRVHDFSSAEYDKWMEHFQNIAAAEGLSSLPEEIQRDLKQSTEEKMMVLVVKWYTECTGEN